MAKIVKQTLYYPKDREHALSRVIHFKNKNRITNYREHFATALWMLLAKLNNAGFFCNYNLLLLKHLALPCVRYQFFIVYHFNNILYYQYIVFCSIPRSPVAIHIALVAIDANKTKAGSRKYLILKMQVVKHLMEPLTHGEPLDIRPHNHSGIDLMEYRYDIFILHLNWYYFNSRRNDSSDYVRETIFVGYM